jgi:Domain of unknown function (DUF4157)
MAAERERAAELVPVRPAEPAPAQVRAPSVGTNSAYARMLQRFGTRSQGAGPLDPEIGSSIGAARSGGAPLPSAVQADMERQFGTDFSAVRVHTGARSDELNRSVQAEAFTTGTDIFFSAGSFDPAGTQGRELLAHELTHVVQQTAGFSGGDARVSHPRDPAETQARAVARAVAATSVGSAPLEEL